MADTKFSLSPGAILPRDMNARQFGEWARAQKSEAIRSGATGYDSGKGVWFGDDGGTTKFFIGDAAGSKVTWDGETLSIIGDMVLGSDNFLRSGQTDYDTGTGFWIGNDGGTPKFSIGNSAGDKLTWNGSVLELVGGLEFNQVDEFTPGWGGFSSAPTGAALYLNLGSVVIIWPKANNNTFTGTSDANTFTMTGVPAAVRPPSTAVPGGGMVDAFDANGNAIAKCWLSDAGVVTFEAQGWDAVNNKITWSAAGWANTGSKGWSGFLMFPIAQTPKSV